MENGEFPKAPESFQAPTKEEIKDAIHNELLYGNETPADKLREDYGIGMVEKNHAGVPENGTKPEQAADRETGQELEENLREYVTRLIDEFHDLDAYLRKIQGDQGMSDESFYWFCLAESRKPESEIGKKYISFENLKIELRDMHKIAEVRRRQDYKDIDRYL